MISTKPVDNTDIGMIPYCGDPRAPCACDPHNIHLDKAALVPVTEYVCNLTKTSTKLIPQGFECAQLTTKIWVGQLDIAIDVRSGCELRCTGKDCSR